LLGAMVAFALAMSIVMGIKQHAQHFVMAILVVSSFIVLIILFRWYQQGDLDPKFKFLIAFCIFVVAFACAVDLAYVWMKPPPLPPSEQCGSLFQFSSGSCISVPNWNICTLPGACIRFTSGQPGVPKTGVCFNCTIAPPSPVGPPVISPPGNMPGSPKRTYSLPDSIQKVQKIYKEN